MKVSFGWRRLVYVFFIFILIALGLYYLFISIRDGVKDDCDQAYEVALDQSSKKYLKSWVQGYAAKNKSKIYRVRHRLGEVNTRTDNRAYELINLDLRKLGFKNKGGSVYFIREREHWAKPIDIDDVKSIGVGTGPSMVIYQVRDVFDISDLPPLYESESVDMVSEGVSVMCSERTN